MITDLKPYTTYSYRIENASGMVFEQGEGTFTTAQIGTGIIPYSMFGRLVNPKGEPLSGMLLLMKLRNPATGVESGLLSAVSDHQGYWVMNLANLKEKNKGLPYSWSEGDEVQLTILGGHLRVSYSAYVQPGSPHNFALDIQQANPPEQNTGSDSKPVPVTLPKAFSLSQNFPNPFNPSTTIQFSMPEGAGAQRLRLEIFNLRGQLVNTLADGIYEPGNYQVQWQGEDSQGNRVTSGVYFYRLSTPQFKVTRKMVILK